MPDLPTGTITFLFTDIEGSTRLLQRLGPGAGAAWSAHRALLRAAFSAHGGVEVETQGDAFLVAFPAGPQAVAAAAQGTQALAEHPWPEGAVVRVRMGLHSGTAQPVGDHYVGVDVHRAARIAAAGHGGQVLLSQTTRDHVVGVLPEGCVVRELGLYRLKDLQEPERLYQLVLPGLPADFPPLRTLDLRPHNLPAQPTPLLGRDAELAALSAQMRRDDIRLVTLTGPGGIGKTHLAVQVAAELVEAFADGVWFVRLSRLVDPTLVVPTIAQTLGLTETGSQALADLLQAYVADRRLLLVLDNFEQVVGAAPALATLLGSSPGLRLLVTSRVPLHLRGEREYALAPLPLPAPGRLSPERLSQYAAVALFIERAQAVRADFAVTAANAPAIAEICARLDGLPLAIELAATRVRVLPPEALLGRLATQLKLLTGGARDAEERQQTMRAAIAWSEALLAPEAQVLFLRLAVFVGGCTLEAAETVCAAPAGAAPLDLDVLEGLTALVEQSLVQQREEGGEARFGMLHVIREYALERLEASGEAEALRRAHTTCYLALAERAEPALRGPEMAAWLGRLEAEHDNLRAALGWARERGEAEIGLRLAATLRRFWMTHGHLREGRAWVEGLLALAAEGTADPAPPAADRAGDALVARALLAGGAVAEAQGDYAAAEVWLEEAASRARAADDLSTAALALSHLGVAATHQDDLERAAPRFEETLALHRQLGNRHGIGMALNNLAAVAVVQGDLERAAAALAEALAHLRAVGDRMGVALTLSNLAGAARKQGELARAEALLREALALARELGAQRNCAAFLEDLAATAGVEGQGARAARLLGAAAAARETIGAPQPSDERADTVAAVAAARAALGEEQWAAAFALGRELSLEEAIAEALGETS